MWPHASWAQHFHPCTTFPCVYDISAHVWHFHVWHFYLHMIFPSLYDNSASIWLFVSICFSESTYKYNTVFLWCAGRGRGRGTPPIGFPSHLRTQTMERKEVDKGLSRSPGKDKGAMAGAMAAVSTGSRHSPGKGTMALAETGSRRSPSKRDKTPPKKCTKKNKFYFTKTLQYYKS